MTHLILSITCSCEDQGGERPKEEEQERRRDQRGELEYDTSVKRHPRGICERETCPK